MAVSEEIEPSDIVGMVGSVGAQTQPMEGFCTSGRDMVRARFDLSTGRELGQWFECKHGVWMSLEEARAVHAFEWPEVIQLEPVGAPTRAGREGDSQPLPIGNNETDTQTKLIEWIGRRRALGVERYGHPLQPNNGRDSLWDAVEEALDQVTYLLNYWREQNPGKDLPS